ncbi:SAM-dependent methyltransferase [Rhodoplanes elegans]|uniref:SAM-dependent methyltransferase n=1 Tax=Rhodoplanes elegans TaxID=29408 RepID=A0A327KDS1_9BRAD|nr:class I SAM-dependent methyltransferase [Rhodoplanes elegans]MBK5957466.1 SAM-dependent methyltransferase [Rhodoplanes elegans]RAI36284.1 SAM-dependent methyltransferase [Rhodoplanes elegans]
MSTIRDWVGFWDSPHSIYVNARHIDVHYRDIATAIAGFVPGPQARVLDFGCGEALHSDIVAKVARTVVLSDAAPTVRHHLADRFRAVPNIQVASPEQLAAMPPGSFDLIVANSVVQYLSRDNLDGLLAEWRRLLAPDGALIVADVIPPDVGALSDLFALLRYAAANGFLVAALVGVVRTAFSSYSKLRQQLGIAKYTEEEFRAILTKAGFTAERLPGNMEHNPARISFRARPVG